MKQKTILVFIMFVLLSATSLMAAGDAKEEKIEFKNQTLCPIMGGKIDSSSYTDIQGQRVYHCCNGCSSKLESDPDKYFNEAAAQGILFENIQTTCPVSGEKLTDKKSSIYFEGRTIKFCCDGCIAPFKKDSQKFLKAMDNVKKESKEVKKEDHSGHNH